MKLSQAIREGCKQTGPLKEFYLGAEEGRLCACALGAAFLAIAEPGARQEALRLTGVKYTQAQAERLVEKELAYQFGGLFEIARVPVDFGQGGVERLPLKKAVMALNDELGWEREKIADYLEGFEL